MDRVNIELSSSVLVTTVLAIVHLGALIVILTLSLAPHLTFFIAIPLLASLAYTTSHYALRITPHAIKHLSALADNKWLLTTKNGNESLARLTGDSVLSRPLLVLNFLCENSSFPKHVIICANNKDQTGLRRLRAWVNNTN